MKYVIYNGKQFVCMREEPKQFGFSKDSAKAYVFLSAQEASEHLSRMTKNSKKNCLVRRYTDFGLLETSEHSAQEDLTDDAVSKVQLTNPMSNLPRDVTELQKICLDVEKQLLEIENFFVGLDVQMESVRKRISESDMAREDIEHKIELSEHLSAEEGNDLCQLLRNIRRERRCYKDILRLLQGAELAQCNYWKNRGISQIIEQLSKREYHPRIFPDLFKKDPMKQKHIMPTSTITAKKQKLSHKTQTPLPRYKKTIRKNPFHWTKLFQSCGAR